MKTLKLFNAVLEKDSKDKPFVSEDGYVIESKALWAKDRITDYYKKEALSGNDLNRTFHKSWKKVKDSTRGELLVHQILHYITTYGTNFEGDMYIPDEVLKVPDTKVVFKVVRGYTKEQLTEKCLGMLRSGMALKEETIDDLLSILTDELGYKFTGDEKLKNKEAVVKIADLYGIIPNDFMGFFRYILYRSTNSALIIKNKETIEAIKASSYNPAVQFKKFGLEKLAENFNRFKPLFLAYKEKCPKLINRLSKLSKKLHKPMVTNPLNQVTQKKLTLPRVKADLHWLDNATPYALFKALTACYNRMNGQNTFMYKIRNGKSWVKETTGGSVCEYNYHFLLKYMQQRFKSLQGKKIFVPDDVVYALPTSEKMYVGNIPTGSKFYGSKLAVGIYWRNSWGANDLDLSGQSIDGKIGWDRSFYNEDQTLIFSGDITNAPNGAVEYLYAKTGLKTPVLVKNNVFSAGYYGEKDADKVSFKIIVGRGDAVNKKYMMNPNNLFMEVKVDAVQTQSIIGLFLPEGKRQSFVVLNMGAGHARVSGHSKVSDLARIALSQEWSNPLSFNSVAEALGATFVKEAKDADIDLTLSTLERDTFINIFK
jgi:hypothetical protein